MSNLSESFNKNINKISKTLAKGILPVTKNSKPENFRRRKSELIIKNKKNSDLGLRLFTKKNSNYEESPGRKQSVFVKNDSPQHVRKTDRSPTIINNFLLLKNQDKLIKNFLQNNLNKSCTKSINETISINSFKGQLPLRKNNSSVNATTFKNFNFLEKGRRDLGKARKKSRIDANRSSNNLLDNIYNRKENPFVKESKSNFSQKSRKMTLNSLKEIKAVSRKNSIFMQLPDKNDKISQHFSRKMSFLINENRKQHTSNQSININKNRVLKKQSKMRDSLTIDEDDNHLIQQSCFVIMPDNIFKELWDILVFILLMYILIMDPINLAFNDIETTGTYFFNSFINMVYIFDIVFNFFIGYYDFEENLIMNYKLIAMNYFSGSFFLDFISAIPFELIFSLLYNNSSLIKSSKLINFSKVFRLTKLSRLFKIMKLVNFLKNGITLKGHTKSFGDLSVDSTNCRLMQFFFYFLIFSHISSCIWIYLGNLDTPNWLYNAGLSDLSDIEIYVASIYFNFTTIFTVGYGDILSTNYLERIYNLFLMIVGVMIFSFTLTSISSVVASSDGKTINYNTNIETLDDFKIKYNIKADLYNKILQFLKNDYLLNKIDKRLLLKGLPNNLKNKLIFQIYEIPLTNLKFFRNTVTDFKYRAVMMLKSNRVYRKDYLINEGDLIEDLYFVKKGALYIEKYSVFGKIKIGEISKNDHFGDVYMNLNKASPIDIYVKSTSCDIYIMTKTDFTILSDEFPKMIKMIIKHSLFTTAKIDILTKEKTDNLKQKIGIVNDTLEQKVSLSYLNLSKDRFSLESNGTISIKNETINHNTNNDIIKIINMDINDEEEVKINKNNINACYRYSNFNLPPIMEETDNKNMNIPMIKISGNGLLDTTNKNLVGNKFSTNNLDMQATNNHTFNTNYSNFNLTNNSNILSRGISNNLINLNNNSVSNKLNSTNLKLNNNSIQNSINNNISLSNTNQNNNSLSISNNPTNMNNSILQQFHESDSDEVESNRTPNLKVIPHFKDEKILNENSNDYIKNLFSNDKQGQNNIDNDNNYHENEDIKDGFNIKINNFTENNVNSTGSNHANGNETNDNYPKFNSVSTFSNNVINDNVNLIIKENIDYLEKVNNLNHPNNVSRKNSRCRRKSSKKIIKKISNNTNINISYQINIQNNVNLNHNFTYGSEVSSFELDNKKYNLNNSNINLNNSNINSNINSPGKSDISNSIDNTAQKFFKSNFFNKTEQSPHKFLFPISEVLHYSPISSNRDTLPVKNNDLTKNNSNLSITSKIGVKPGRSSYLNFTNSINKPILDQNKIDTTIIKEAIPYDEKSKLTRGGTKNLEKPTTTSNNAKNDLKHSNIKKCFDINTNFSFKNNQKINPKKYSNDDLTAGLKPSSTAKFNLSNRSKIDKSGEDYPAFEPIKSNMSSHKKTRKSERQTVNSRNNLNYLYLSPKKPSAKKINDIRQKSQYFYKEIFSNLQSHATFLKNPNDYFKVSLPDIIKKTVIKSIQGQTKKIDEILKELKFSYKKNIV